jgi:hypothetical protein
MASEFDFLRVKWPKLAAMAADATRLADVSPSSALSSLRTYCEWATDIALDLYELQVAGGASQIEKLEALQTSGLVPADILQKFHNVRSAGTRTSLREMESSAKLVHSSVADCLDIGQWLFREAEKEGWPHVEGYAQSYGAIPMAGVQGSSEVAGYDVGGGDYGRKFSLSRFVRRYTSLISLVVAVVVIGGLGVAVSYGLKSCQAEEADPVTTLNFTPSPVPSPTNIIAATPTLEPTPEEDPFDYIADLGSPSSNSGPVYFDHWDINDNQNPFTMGDKIYEHGMAFYVEADRITHDKGSNTVAWYLDGKYDRITFDLGCEKDFQYDVRSQYGSYKIIVRADDQVMWESERYDYEDVILDKDIRLGDNCSRLEIKLEQYKGEKGTLNVVLGDFKLYEIIDEEEEE